MTGKTTKAVMAIFAVALMMMVAFVPAISVLTDDGSDGAITAGAFAVTVQDKKGDPLAGMTIAVVITGADDSEYTVPVAFITVAGNVISVAAGVFNAGDKSVKITLTDPNTTGTKYTFPVTTLKNADITGNAVTIKANEYTISGTVKTSSDIGIPNAVVDYKVGTTNGTVKTDDNGAYSFAAAEGSSVEVTVATQIIEEVNHRFFGSKAVFTSVEGNYSATEYPRLAFVSNQDSNQGYVKDAAGAVIEGAVVSYYINSDTAKVYTAVTGADGKYVAYFNLGGSATVTGVSYTGGAYTFAVTAQTRSHGADFTDIDAKEYTATGKVISAVTSVALADVSITLSSGSSTAGVTVKKIDDKTGTDGTFRMTYTTTTVASGVSQVVVSLSKANYAFPVFPAIDLSGTPPTFADFMSSTILVKGTVGDSNENYGELLEGFTISVAAGKNADTTPLTSNATFPSTVTVDSDGAYYIPVTPKTGTPATGYTNTPIITVKASGTSNVFGYTFDVATEGAGLLSNQNVAAGTDLPVLKAKQSSVTVAVMPAAAFGNGNSYVALKYTVGGTTTKTIIMAGDSTSFPIKAASGASITNISFDTTSKKITADGVERDNAAYGKVTNPGTASPGVVFADVTVKFTDVTPASTVSTTVTVSPVPSASSAAAMSYTDENGKIAYATPITSGAFPATVMLKGTSFNVYMRGYETSTTAVGNAAVTVTLSLPLTYTIFAKGYTVDGADQALPGMTVLYAVTDEAIANPTIADLTKSAVTNADGKVVINVIKDQHVTYFVKDTLKSYTWASIDASGAVTTSNNSDDATAEQNGGITGVISTFDGKVAMSGVTVGYEFYKTAESRTGTATATVKTNAAGVYFIPKVNGTTTKLATYPVMSGYDFGLDATPFKAATYFVTDVTASDQVAVLICGQKTTAVVKNVTVSISYMASSSLENNANSDNAEIVAPGVTNKMKVGETVKFTAPEVKGFTFSGWYLNGVNVSDSKDKTVCNFTATEAMEYDSPELVAVYGADSVSAPAQGVSNAVIIIGVIAVIIALLAVAYVVIQTKKKD